MIIGKDFSDLYVGYDRENITNNKHWIFNTDELKMRKDNSVGKFHFSVLRTEIIIYLSCHLHIYIFNPLVLLALMKSIFDY